MSTRTAKIITAVAMLAGVGLYVGWDIVVAALGIDPATISRVLLAWGYVNTFTPFVTGVVIGHVWWPGKVPGYALVRYISLSVIGVTVLVLDLTVLPPIVPIVSFMAGVPLGRLLWTQAKRHMEG